MSADMHVARGALTVHVALCELWKDARPFLNIVSYSQTRNGLALIREYFVRFVIIIRNTACSTVM